ncbi:MAG TPA: ZIP family metal transporter [Candidatus Binatia bacterium]|nr:ZIP family metal transporter [Candidatus Binatia bacterium]
MLEKSTLDPITAGFLASLAAGLATGVGALPALVVKKAPDRLLDAMLGFAAGIMIAASVFGLLVPSFRLGGVSITVLGFLLGAAFLDGANVLIPHWHRLRGLEGPSAQLRRVWLLLLAMAIHNVPEGLAVGISFGEDDLTAGLVIAMGIGLQNVPEGLAIAFPMMREGYSRWRAVIYATLAGLVEPVWGLVGITLVTLAKSLLPAGLAFAAGAMLYVVFQEILPESHKRGYQREATFSTLFGMLVMVILAYFVSP